VVNTLFGYSLYAVLVFYEIPSLIALFVSTIGGILFNYFSLSKVVFLEVKGPLVLIRFLMSYLFVYLVNSVMLFYLIDLGNINPYFGQIVCIPIAVSLSWVLLRSWVYRRG